MESLDSIREFLQMDVRDALSLLWAALPTLGRGYLLAQVVIFFVAIPASYILSLGQEERYGAW